jgi:hypothetical protein
MFSDSTNRAVLTDSYIARYIDQRGRLIVHATDKPAPVDDDSWLDSDAWRAWLKRVPKWVKAEKPSRAGSDRQRALPR